MSNRVKSKFIGVYTRTSAQRKCADGKPDVCFDISYKTPEGKLIYEKVGWRSEGYSALLASKHRSDKLQSLRHPEIAASLHQKARGCITLDNAFSIFEEKWLPSLKNPNSELKRWHTYIAPYFGHKKMCDIGPMDIEIFKQTLLVRPCQRKQGTLSSSTVRLCLADVRRLYRKMQEWGLYDGTIPTAHMKMPKADNMRVRFLTAKEADRLLCCLGDISCRFYYLAAISLYTGMRIGEILQLRAQDVDIEHGIINTDGKTGQRTAYISNAVRPVFLVLLRNLHPTSLLFVNKFGEQSQNNTLGKTFQRAVNILGLNDGITDRRQKVVFHTLRHTFASWLAMKGVPLFTIGELIGHTTVQMTRRYAKLSPDTKRNALEYIDATLRG